VAPNPRLTQRTRSALWAAGVALVASAPLVAILASGRTLVWRDSGRLFAPLRVLVVEGLRDRRLPAWNPFEGLGVPLFAQAMHSVLHPVSIAAAFLAPGAGLDPIMVAHVILASTGAFVLAREVGASPAGAALAGLAFGLSGYVLSMSSILQYLAAAGTAPWTAAALLAAGKGRRFGLPAAAAVVAIQAFAGDPQWLLLSAALGMGLAWATGGPGGAGRALVGIVAGAALGAVQLVPSWEYFQETTRAVMLDDIDRVQWALSPLRLAELVVPGLFFGRPGEGSAPVFTWLGGPSTYLMPFVPSVFVGGATVWLALVGARASRATRFLAVATVVLLWIALGTWLGATQVLRELPVWGAFRYSEKMVGPLTLCLAVLAGVGADRIEPGRRPALLAGAVAAAAGVLALVAAFWPGVLGALQAAGASPAIAPEARHRLIVGLPQASAGLAILAAAFGVASGTRRTWFPALAAGAVTVAALGAAPFALYAGEQVDRDDSLLGPVRASDPFARISVPFGLNRGPSNLDHWARLEWMESRMGLPSHSVLARVGNIDAYSGVLPTRYMLVAGAFAERFGPARLQAFRRLGLTHVVIGDPGSEQEADLARTAVDGARLLRQDREWGASVWEVPHRPWASFAPGAVSAGDQAGATRALLDLMADGRLDVVVEGPHPSGFSPGRVLGASREAERVRVEAESSGPGLLVLNDAWAPGWKATIDGAPVRVFPADVVTRAVPWPAGRHTLEMRYEMPGLRAGLWITALGALALAGLLVASVGRKP
jgi:hypothetical protein